MFMNALKLERNDNIKYLDVCKGLGILLVIYNHSAPLVLKQWVGSFHMPLFFVISGMLCARSKIFVKGNTAAFLKSRMKSLLMPYYMFGVLDFIVYGLISPDAFNQDNGVTRQIIFFLLGKRSITYYYFTGTLWFLTVLFFCQIFTFLLRRIVNKDIGLAIVMLVLVVMDCFVIEKLPVLPFNMDLVPFALTFFLVGYIISKDIGLDNLFKTVNESILANYIMIVTIGIVLVDMTIAQEFSMFSKAFSNVGLFIWGGYWVVCYSLLSLLGYLQMKTFCVIFLHYLEVPALKLWLFISNGLYIS